ncbi:MAG TPA: amidase [Candidatus Sulfomarinibacteraceae bacterium]|nr:amidase [Candidatus Sulfomarinibacteraceae bacterium]
MTDLAHLDAIGQADLVRRGKVSALELVDAAIERIETLNPRLNAVVTTLFDEARDVARGPLPAGPLAGVPVLLKDLGTELAGTRQTSGSRALRNYISAQDAELAIRYRGAGLIVVGKSSTPEFGNHSTTEPELFGPTRNPWAPDRTAGGSSGGSAAAVAAGMVPAAHGGDGAGSIRIPASCCGLVGLKPTRGRNSRAPSGESVAGLAVEHAITRSVRDSAAILDATSGPAPGDPSLLPSPERPFLDEVGRDPGRLRIAWTAEPPIDAPVDPACRAAVRSTAGLLERLGHDVEEARAPFDGDVLLGPLGVVWAMSNQKAARDAARALGRPLERDDLEITTWELVEYADRFDGADLMAALDELATACRAIAPFFARYDAWLTPTLAGPPLPLGVLNRSRGGAMEWWHFDCSFNPWNPIANVTGQPAISLPLDWTDEGLPIGSLIFGRFADEATLFRLAGQLEAAHPWASRWPPISALV